MKRAHMVFIAFLMAAVALSACSSDEQKKQSHFAKGKEYFDKGEYKSARIEFKNAIQIDSRFARAHLMLGETSLKLGDAQDAFRSYSAVAEIEPTNTEAQLKLATFLLLGQKYPDARKRVDDILAREPNNVDALLLLATLHGHDENLFEAANCFKKVIDINSRETRAYLGPARVLAQQGQTTAAEQALMQAVAIDSNRPRTDWRSSASTSASVNTKRPMSRSAGSSPTTPATATCSSRWATSTWGCAGRPKPRRPTRRRSTSTRKT